MWNPNKKIIKIKFIVCIFYYAARIFIFRYIRIFINLFFYTKLMSIGMCGQLFHTVSSYLELEFLLPQKIQTTWHICPQGFKAG